VTSATLPSSFPEIPLLMLERLDSARGTAPGQPLDFPVLLLGATNRQTQLTRIVELMISPLGDCKILPLSIRQRQGWA
jgi:hypothetical protein